MDKAAFIIRHVEFEDLGTLKDVLTDNGYKITYFEAGYDNLSQIHDAAPDLLVILGGPISAYDNIRYPFLNEELRILKARIDQNLPTLGICLGAQLIAIALGAEVYGGHVKEIGWSSLIISDDGMKNGFEPFLNSNLKVLHWHGDTFNLPKNALLLASSDIYKNQAFSYNSKILALQFHIEVQENQIEKWLIGHANELYQLKDIDINQLRSDTKNHAANLQSAAKHLLANWLLHL